MVQNKSITTAMGGLNIFEIPGVLRSFHPVRRVPALFDSPHSGQNYPLRSEFNYACAHEHLTMVEDTWVDELISAAPGQGITMLEALAPRSFVDMNRTRDCINPKDIRGDWEKVQFDWIVSHQAQVGCGVIPTKTGRGLQENIYHEHTLPDDAEINARLEKYYDPYHTALCNMIEELREEFGACYHINAHSMPRPCSLDDFVIGNLYGHSTKPEFTAFVKNTLQNHPIVQKNAWRVGINSGLGNPLAGGEILQRHSDPQNNIHSLQLEINRTLYMDEHNREPHSGFEEMQQVMSDLALAVSTYALENRPSLRLQPDAGPAQFY